MAVKVTRANKQMKQEVINEIQNTGLSNEGIALVRMFQRFDMIQTYTNSISAKMDELYTDLCKCEGGNPLLILHIKTINLLLSNIDTQIAEATTTDLKVD